MITTSRPLLFIILAATALATPGCPTHEKAPPGEITAYRPVTYFDRIRRDCGPSCKLLKMTAKNVRSDGTMDLTERSYHAQASYEFQRIQGGKAGADWTDDKKRKDKDKNKNKKFKLERVVISVPDTGSSKRRDKMTMGMKVHTHNKSLLKSEVVKGPECKLADLWKKAQADGADADMPATITYDRSGYLFEIEVQNFKRRFDLSCQLLWSPGTTVRPVKDLSHIMGHVPDKDRAGFVELTAREVKADGTADTRRDEAWVRYKLALWKRAGQREEEMEIMLRRGELRKSRKFLTLGAKPKVIRPPTCDFEGLWKIALEHGADAAKTARITYDSGGYVFRQAPPVFKLAFGADCALKR